MYKSRNLNVPSNMYLTGESVTEGKDYVGQRHIVSDHLEREITQDFPDHQGLEMPNYQVLGGKPTATIDNADLSEFELRRRQASMMRFKSTTEKVVDDKNKLKNYYENYIKDLENENQRMKQVESEFLTMQSQKRILEEEIKKLILELDQYKNLQGVDDSGRISTLQKRLKELNDEKLHLLQLIDINKAEINNMSSKVTTVQNTFSDKETLLKQIENLKIQLRNTQGQIVTQEKIVYKDVIQPVIQETQVLRAPSISRVQTVQRPVEIKVETKKEMTKACICQCNCQCHLNHCNGHCDKQFQTIKKYDEYQYAEKPKIVDQNRIMRVSYQTQGEQRMEMPKTEVRRISVPKVTQQSQIVTPKIETRVSRQVTKVEQQPQRKLMRSHSQKRHVMDLVHNKEFMVEDNSLKWEKPLNLNYTELSNRQLFYFLN